MSEEQQQELSLEEQDQQEQQAYLDVLAGRNEARTPEVPTQDSAKPEDDRQQEAPAEAAQPEQEPEKPVFAGLTESQLRAKLEKIDEIDKLRGELAGETRKVYGKVGELNGELKQLRELQKQPQSLTPEALKRLQDEFPDLAEILGSGAVEKQRGKSAEDIEREFNDRLQTAIKDTRDGLEKKLIAVQHKDWQEIPQTEEFKVWINAIPAEQAKALMESEDGMEVADGLTQFKAWREDYRKQQEATAEAERQKQDKKARLEAAAQPSGVAPAAMQGVATEEEAYQQARAEAARLRRRR